MSAKFFLLFVLLAGTLVWAGNELVSAFYQPQATHQHSRGNGAATEPPDYEITIPPAEFTFAAPDETAMLARPLFEPTRDRPAPKAVAEAAAVQQATPQPALPQPLTAEIMGTILQNGSDILVMRIDPSSPTLRVSIGDKVQGWELTEITESGAVFKREDETTALQLLLK